MASQSARSQYGNVIVLQSYSLTLSVTETASVPVSVSRQHQRRKLYSGSGWVWTRTVKHYIYNIQTKYSCQVWVLIIVLFHLMFLSLLGRTISFQMRRDGEERFVFLLLQNVHCPAGLIESQYHHVFTESLS